MNSASEV